MFVVVIQFRSSSNVHVRQCDLFGQVHICRSYSFGHVDSVKRLFLLLNYLIYFIINKAISTSSAGGFGSKNTHDQRILGNYLKGVNLSCSEVSKRQ